MAYSNQLDKVIARMSDDLEHLEYETGINSMSVADKLLILQEQVVLHRARWNVMEQLIASGKKYDGE